MIYSVPIIGTIFRNTNQINKIRENQYLITNFVHFTYEKKKSVFRYFNLKHWYNFIVLHFEFLVF